MQVFIVIKRDDLLRSRALLRPKGIPRDASTDVRKVHGGRPAGFPLVIAS